MSVATYSVAHGSSEDESSTNNATDDGASNGRISSHDDGERDCQSLGHYRAPFSPFLSVGIPGRRFALLDSFSP